jgi:hypothetical protein
MAPSGEWKLPPTVDAATTIVDEALKLWGAFLGRTTAFWGKVKAIMNEANNVVREAARNLVVEILGAMGIEPQEMESSFGEGSAGAAIELRLTQFAGAILEQAKPKPSSKALSRAFGEVG